MQDPPLFDRAISRRDFLRGSAATSAALAFSGCDLGAIGPAQPPNIVVVVLDTVRRDHLSAYGYERDTSPFLATLCSEGRRYENGYSTSCWTVPSHVSLLSGLHAASHGSRWGNIWIDRDLNLLPAILQRRGYKTFAAAENRLVSPKYGYLHGWDTFSNPKTAFSGDEWGTITSIRRMLDGVNDPFFMMVNFVEAHWPYSGGGPFKNRYLSDPAYESYTGFDFLRTMSGELPFPDDAQLRHLVEHYDAEVRFVDSLLEQVVDILKANGQWESCLLAVVSDHGEGFGEHGMFDHQFALYENLIQIPLVVRWPGEATEGSVTGRPSSLVDFFPTALRAAEIDSSGYPHQGMDLMVETDATRTLFAETYLHQAFREDQGRRGIRSVGEMGSKIDVPTMRAKYARGLQASMSNGKKLIRGDDGSEELFDLANDPGELESLSNSDAIAPTMRAEMDGAFARFRNLRDGGTDVRRALDEDAVEDLSALGYF